MFRSGSFHPGLWNDLLAVPQTFLQIKLSKLGHILGAEEKSPATFGNALWTGFPEITCNSKRFEKPWFQVFYKSLAGTLCNNSGKHICVQAVVEKIFSRISGNRGVKKASKPVISRNNARFIKGNTACHGKKIFYSDGRVENLGKGT